MNCIVEKTDDDSVIVQPLEKGEACATCRAHCASSCAVRFAVANTKGFPVREGQTVKVALSTKHEAAQSVFSLAFPVVSAVAGFFAANPIARMFNKNASEAFHAICALAFLACACAIVLFVSRKKPNREKLDIVEIC